MGEAASGDVVVRRYTAENGSTPTSVVSIGTNLVTPTVSNVSSVLLHVLENGFFTLNWYLLNRNYKSVIFIC